MTELASFTLRGRNPDVLTCIANLSNDEVFTPPEFANRMLDTLTEAWAASHNGADIWADKTVKFLDPFTKSGVFLREITNRLTKGLEKEIPELEGRVNHILTQQVFGIAITHLTSLLARRSVYCSKHANGQHSIAKSFTNDSFFRGRKQTRKGDVTIYQNGGTGYVARQDVETGTELIDKWKIYVGRAAPGTGNRDTYPHRILSTPFIGEPGSICSETYLCIGPFETQSEAESALSYICLLYTSDAADDIL
jgi:hypothetical protein